MASYDASITAFFGGDTTGLQAAVAESETYIGGFEKRLNEMGISWSDTPKKFAQESAKAFEEVYKAESDLAAFREAESFRRASTEEKLTLLQGQRTRLVEQIGGIEGETLQKKQLTLELEKKTFQYTDLMKVRANEVKEAQQATATAVTEQTKSAGGLSGIMEGVKKSAKDIGISIKGAGIGIFFASVISLGKEAIANAQKTRDELERMGKPVDGATRSMAAFGDGLQSVRKLGVVAVGTIISGWTQIGDLIGSGINRLRGISEAQENIAIQTERAARAQEEKAKALRAELYDRERVRDAAKSANEAEAKAAYDRADAEKQWGILAERNLALRQQMLTADKDSVTYHRIRNELAQNSAELREKDIQLVRDGLKRELDGIKAVGEYAQDNKQQLGLLTVQQRTLEQAILTLQEKGVSTTAEEAELRRVLLERSQVLLAITEETNTAKERAIALTNEEAAAAARVVAQKQEQLRLQEEIEARARSAFLGQIVTGQFESAHKIEDIQRASTDVLRKLRADTLKKISDVDNDWRDVNAASIASGHFGRDLAKVPLTADLSNIDRELALRQQMNADYNFGGRTLAMENFKGDPLAFENVFQSLVTGMNSQEKAAKDISDIRTLLSNVLKKG